MSTEEHPNTKRYETQIYRTSLSPIHEIMNRDWAAAQATWRSSRDLERNFPWATREEPEESRAALQDRRPANFPHVRGSEKEAASVSSMRPETSEDEERSRLGWEAARTASYIVTMRKLMRPTISTPRVETGMHPAREAASASPESSDTAQGVKHLTDTLLDTTLDDQTRSDAADELAYEHNTMVSMEPKHRIGGSRLKPEARAATATSRKALEVAMFGAPQSQGRYERRRAQLPSRNT